MIRFSEYVSLGHPDKTADYISSYLLDRYIERDPATRYAVEVQIKNHRVTLGGEVSSECQFTDEEITEHVRAAVREIGYTREYYERWGEGNTICADLLTVESLITQQSPDIAQGCVHGWGDQGIFFGFAASQPNTCYMPEDYTIARRLNKALFESGLGGLDIKTQVVLKDHHIEKVIVAIPLLDTLTGRVESFVRKQIEGGYRLIVNGTGSYTRHSTVADCGTTGRKLAVDFYGGNCRIGGGSPWTKDGSKADLSLNLCARKLAKQYAAQSHCDVEVSLACCIGTNAVDMYVQDAAGRCLAAGEVFIEPQEVIRAYGLDKPRYAEMCRWGLFGEYQADRAWEK